MADRSKADLSKVAVIFEAFDTDKDARLNMSELVRLIQRCNPSTPFSTAQLEAITQEVSVTYYFPDQMSTFVIAPGCALVESALITD